MDRTIDMYINGIIKSSPVTNNNLKSKLEIINNNLIFLINLKKEDKYQFIYERLNPNNSIVGSPKQLLDYIIHKLKNNDAAIKGIKKLNTQLDDKQVDTASSNNGQVLDENGQVLDEIWSVIFKYNEDELISLDINDHNPDVYEEEDVYKVFKFLDKAFEKILEKKPVLKKILKKIKQYLNIAGVTKKDILRSITPQASNYYFLHGKRRKSRSKTKSRKRTRGSRMYKRTLRKRRK
jgi:hypothetical protein